MAGVSVSRRRYLAGSAATLGGLLAAACGEAQIRYVEKIVEKPVIQEKVVTVEKPVVVEKIVEKKVKVPVIQEKVVTVEKPVIVEKIVEKKVEVPAKAKGPVSLRMHYRSEKYVPERIKVFMERNPSINVEPVSGSGYQKLLVEIAAGTLGDVMWASTGVGSYFKLAWHGWFMDLDPLVKRDKFDLKAFIPRAIATARIPKDNRLQALPSLMHIGGICLFYNATLFEKAGLKMPPQKQQWTYDDLTEAARKLTADTDRDGKTDQWGVRFGAGRYWTLVSSLRSWGGEWIDPPFKGKKVAFDRPKAMQQWQWQFDVRHKHLVHPVEGRDKASFPDGNLAMQQGGMWNAGWAKSVKDKFKMDATLLPKQPGVDIPQSQGHVDMWTVNSRTPFPDEAWLLLQFITSKESNLAGPGVEHNIPGARIESWNDPKFRARQPMGASGRPMFEVFREFATEVGPGPIAVPYNFKMLEMDQLTRKLWKPLLQGTKGPVQLVAEIKGQYQALLDQAR